eukprot:Skav210480  [mRNA]  locus=scaffold737:661111:661950:- [translate_table: standard]
MEDLLMQAGLTARILLIDLALSPKHDVYQKQLLSTIREWIFAGCVAGVLLAPPCETWSAARALDPGDDAAPRPLRNREDLLGMAGLRPTELDQLAIANYLLYVALIIFLTALCTGTATIMEHPREPRPASYPSIWRLPWVEHFYDHPAVARHMIYQAAFGARFAKPTHLLTAHLPHFRMVMRLHSKPIDWQSLEGLRGKTEGGEWKTAWGKAYPSDMNRALADAHLEAMRTRTAATEISESVRQATDAAFNELYAGHVSYAAQSMQPDYHRLTRLETLD